jgi:protein-L-isoaspartate O-methyltransferase
MVPRLAEHAIARLLIEPHHQILEIGCGGGTAVAAVAARLTTGRILGIDRSGAQVTRASRRNAAYIAGGVARIVQADLSELDIQSQRFDRILALNVNLFQDAPSSTVGLLRRLLRRRGRLVLGYRRADARHLAARAEQVSAQLRAGGLGAPTVDRVGPDHLYLTVIRR